MSLRLKDIYDGLVEQEAQVKLANLQREWEGDTDRVNMLNDALDMIKEAQDKNEIPAINQAEAISLGVELVEQALMEKEAEEWYTIGGEVADLLKEAGVTQEDLAKIATEEDEEAFGRYCARLWLTAKTGEDHLGDA